MMRIREWYLRVLALSKVRIDGDELENTVVSILSEREVR